MRVLPLRTETPPIALFFPPTAVPQPPLARRPACRHPACRRPVCRRPGEDTFPVVCARSVWCRIRIALLAVILAFGLSACDEAPGVEPDPQSPVLAADFTQLPDTVDAAMVPPDRVTDSTVVARISLAAAAEDPDGQIARVVFTIEPASAPGVTIDGDLPPVPDISNVYGINIDLTLPQVDEIYTVRLFAVDDDSLQSNVALSQVRVLPSPDTLATSSGLSLLSASPAPADGRR